MATRNINAVTLTGNLTRDPELRTTPRGAHVLEIGVACNTSEKRGDDWEERADFFDVTVFGKQAETLGDMLKRGTPVAITGRLRQDRWEDKDTGKGRSKVKIIASNVQMTDRGGGNRAQSDFEPPAETSGAYDGAV